MVVDVPDVSKQEKGCFTPPLDVFEPDGQHIALYVLL